MHLPVGNEGVEGVILSPRDANDILKTVCCGIKEQPGRFPVGWGSLTKILQFWAAVFASCRPLLSVTGDTVELIVFGGFWFRAVVLDAASLLREEYVSGLIVAVLGAPVW